MQQNHEILLSTDTQFVTTCEIPALIARALHPTDFLTDTPLLKVEILRCDAEDEHKRLLRTAIATGQLEQLSPASHISTNHYIERGKVPVEALTSYVARFKIGVRFGVTMADLQAAEKMEAVQGIEPSTVHWTAQARAIADECFDRDTANNCRDSLDGYSNRVMEEMQKRGIVGPRGIVDNANTVKREALQAGKWWANKPK